MVKRGCWIGLLFLASVSCGDSDKKTTAASERVGQACVPLDETRADYPGASLNEVVVYDVAADSAVCIVNHYQGRASCPYGQTPDALALPAADEARCRVPDTEEPVSVEVLPSLTGRPAASAVYLSCRCGGEDLDATYCVCPGSMVCSELVKDLGFDSDISGSYCIKSGTEYDGIKADYLPECGAGAPNEQQACGAANP